MSATDTDKTAWPGVMQLGIPAEACLWQTRKRGGTGHVYVLCENDMVVVVAGSGPLHAVSAPSTGNMESTKFH